MGKHVHATSCSGQCGQLRLMKRGLAQTFSAMLKETLASPRSPAFHRPSGASPAAMKSAQTTAACYILTTALLARLLRRARGRHSKAKTGMDVIGSMLDSFSAMRESGFPSAKERACVGMMPGTDLHAQLKVRCETLFFAQCRL